MAMHKTNKNNDKSFCITINAKFIVRTETIKHSKNALVAKHKGSSFSFVLYACENYHLFSYVKTYFFLKSFRAYC